MKQSKKWWARLILIMVVLLFVLLIVFINDVINSGDIHVTKTTRVERECGFWERNLHFWPGEVKCYDYEKTEQ